MDKTILVVISIANFISAFAFSIKFFFVTPTLSGIYYGVVAWICAFGFAILANMK